MGRLLLDQRDRVVVRIFNDLIVMLLNLYLRTPLLVGCIMFVVLVEEHLWISSSEKYSRTIFEFPVW